MEKGKSLQSLLAFAIEATIEEMTFESVQLEETATPEDKSDANHIWARLEIKQPIEGHLVLHASTISARKLAEDVYSGVSEPLSDHLIQDALGEILHTIAGRFARRLVAQDQDFELSLPITGRGKKPELTKTVATVKVVTGGHMLTASILGDGFAEHESIQKINA